MEQQKTNFNTKFELEIDDCEHFCVHATPGVINKKNVYNKFDKILI